MALTVGNHHASGRAPRPWATGQDDRWLCVLPLFHVGGLAILLRSAIYATTAVVHDRFGADRVRSALEHGEITPGLLGLHHAPPAARRRADEAPGLRAVLLGGGPMPSDLLDWARERGLPVAPTYGMTETASQIARAPPDALRESAGEPLLGAAEHRPGWRDSGARADGRASASSARTAGCTRATWAASTRGGRLTVAGRLKDVIVSGGENVMAGRVEEALRAHPAVADAGVAGLADAEWGERVTAWVVLEGRPPTRSCWTLPGAAGAFRGAQGAGAWPNCLATPRASCSVKGLCAAPDQVT